LVSETKIFENGIQAFYAQIKNLGNQVANQKSYFLPKH